MSPGKVKSRPYLIILILSSLNTSAKGSLSEATNNRGLLNVDSSKVTRSSAEQNAASSDTTSSPAAATSTPDSAISPASSSSASPSRSSAAQLGKKRIMMPKKKGIRIQCNFLFMTIFIIAKNKLKSFQTLSTEDSLHPAFPHQHNKSNTLP
jgi:hypothetical protein